MSVVHAMSKTPLIHKMVQAEPAADMNGHQHGLLSMANDLAAKMLITRGIEARQSVGAHLATACHAWGSACNSDKRRKVKAGRRRCKVACVMTHCLWCQLLTRETAGNVNLLQLLMNNTAGGPSKNSCPKLA